MSPLPAAQISLGAPKQVRHTKREASYAAQHRLCELDCRSIAQSLGDISLRNSPFAAVSLAFRSLTSACCSFRRASEALFFK